jgi:hypothetical protein
LVRNVFEQAIGRLANRITGIAPLTREVLTTLQPPDIAMDDVADAVWSSLDSKTRCLHSVCPHCQHRCRIPQTLLGQKVHCKQCQGDSFQLDWADVIEE